MKKKPPHSNTVKKKAAKKHPRYNDTYFCMISWRQKPVHKDIVLDIGKQFYKFAYDLVFNTENPKPYSLTYWRRKVGLPLGTYKTWRLKYPEFKLYTDEAKELLGIIREIGMITVRFGIISLVLCLLALMSLKVR